MASHYQNSFYPIESIQLQGAENVYELSVNMNQQLIAATVVFWESEVHVFVHGMHGVFGRDHLLSDSEEGEALHHVIAPMPGLLTEIFVTPGQQVKKGDRLLVVTAMKMEHTVFAPIDGTVDQVFYAVGDSIEEGSQLLSWSNM